MKINPNPLPKFDKNKYSGNQAIHEYMKDNDIKHYDKVVGKDSSGKYHLFVINMKETSEGYQIMNYKSYCGSITKFFNHYSLSGEFKKQKIKQIDFDLSLDSNIVKCKNCKNIEER